MTSLGFTPSPQDEMHVMHLAKVQDAILPGDVNPIELQLKRISNSDQFFKAPVLTQLLKFLVENKLNGKTDDISAKFIAHELYQSLEKETNVRVSVQRLRIALKDYYEVNRDDEIIISIRKGTYIPDFFVRRDSRNLPTPSFGKEIAGQRAIAASGQLPSKFTPGGVWDLVTEGNALLSERNPVSLAKAGAAFRAALVAGSPEEAMARAYSGLAESYLFQYILGAQHSELFSDALGTAAAALFFAPEDPVSNATMGAVAAIFLWDFACAESHFNKALQLDPKCLSAHGWYSGMLASLGRFEESVLHAKLARSIDPFSSHTSGHLAKIQYLSGDFQGSTVILESLISKEPGNPLVRMLLALNWAALGNLPQAAAILEQSSGPGPADLQVKSVLGNIYARMGRVQEAQGILHELSQASSRAFVPPSYLAQVHLALGNREQALACLEQAIQEKDFNALLLGGSEVFDSLRDDARISGFLTSLGWRGAAG